MSFFNFELLCRIRKSLIKRRLTIVKEKTHQPDVPPMSFLHFLGTSLFHVVAYFLTQTWSNPKKFRKKDDDCILELWWSWIFADLITICFYRRCAELSENKYKDFFRMNSNLNEDFRFMLFTSLFFGVITGLVFQFKSQIVMFLKTVSSWFQNDFANWFSSIPQFLQGFFTAIFASIIVYLWWYFVERDPYDVELYRKLEKAAKKDIDNSYCKWGGLHTESSIYTV